MNASWIFAVGLGLGTVGSVAYWKLSQKRVDGVNVYDGFESKQLSEIWDTSRFVKGAVTMQKNVVRAGRGAAKVVLRKGNIFEKGMNGSNDTERAELMEAPRLMSREGRTYEYSFSEYIPADFPIVPVRLVLAQWKQYCGGDNRPCSDDSPTVAVRYTSGVLRITRQTGRRQETLFESREERQGKWTDFRFNLRFTPGEDGEIRAWVNGSPAVAFRGPTAYAENAETGYSKPSIFFFKMGLYRDVMEEPMSLYIDEYRKQELPE